MRQEPILTRERQYRYSFYTKGNASVIAFLKTSGLRVDPCAFPNYKNEASDIDYFNLDFMHPDAARAAYSLSPTGHLWLAGELQLHQETTGCIEDTHYEASHLVDKEQRLLFEARYILFECEVRGEGGGAGHGTFTLFADDPLARTIMDYLAPPTKPHEPMLCPWD
jgi:hypothetical protein